MNCERRNFYVKTYRILVEGDGRAFRRLFYYKGADKVIKILFLLLIPPGPTFEKWTFLM